MLKRSSKNQGDIDRLTRKVIDLVTGNPITEDVSPITNEKNPAAVALGKLGGKVGGRVRAAALTSKRRKEIAAKAAKARWSKK
jgi:hypothetical protein